MGHEQVYHYKYFTGKQVTTELYNIHLSKHNDSLHKILKILKDLDKLSHHTKQTTTFFDCGTPECLKSGQQSYHVALK